MKYFLAVFLVTLMVAPAAYAFRTVCSEDAAQKYNYGPKAEMEFTVPGMTIEGLGKTMQAFGKENRMFYSGAGLKDEKAGYEEMTYIMQSEPTSEVSISLDANNKSEHVKAVVRTFSFGCGQPEEWKPYWERFRKFAKGNFKEIEERRVYPKKPSRTASGL